MKREPDAQPLGRLVHINRGRCYLRGLTLLGIFNTVCGCLFGQILVKAVEDTGEAVRWYWDAADNHPPEAVDAGNPT